MPDFTRKTKEQAMAQEAFSRVSIRQKENNFEDYKTFALSFPTLIHSCGLVQAVAFAAARDKKIFLEDLEAVFKVIDAKGDLQRRSREAGIMDYMRISRHALTAASWIKRYCQAMERSDNLAE